MLKESLERIANNDPEVGQAMQAEFARQSRNLELIASENIVSADVLRAQGSVLTYR